jgi:endonuclease YncB( thermonuclease family)
MAVNRLVTCLAVCFWITAWGCDNEEGGESICAGGTLATVAVVSDGDTLQTQELDKGIRLAGINAAEKGQWVGDGYETCSTPWDKLNDDMSWWPYPECCYGIAAKQYLELLLAPGTKVCLRNPATGGASLDTDIHNSRYVADVYVGDVWINAKLACGGYVGVYKNSFPHADSGKFGVLWACQTAAQNANMGLWGFCPGAQSGGCSQ